MPPINDIVSAVGTTAGVVGAVAGVLALRLRPRRRADVSADTVRRSPRPGKNAGRHALFVINKGPASARILSFAVVPSDGRPLPRIDRLDSLPIDLDAGQSWEFPVYAAHQASRRYRVTACWKDSKRRARTFDLALRQV